MLARLEDTSTVFAHKSFFSMEVEPAGMLTPEAQATTIEDRVRRR